MQYKPRTQITHKSTKHQRTTFTGVITNTLNLSYLVTVTKQNKIPILTDTYILQQDVLFHRQKSVSQSSMNVRYDYQ